MTNREMYEWAHTLVLRPGNAWTQHPTGYPEHSMMHLACIERRGSYDVTLQWHWSGLDEPDMVNVNVAVWRDGGVIVDSTAMVRVTPDRPVNDQVIALVENIREVDRLCRNLPETP